MYYSGWTSFFYTKIGAVLTALDATPVAINAYAMSRYGNAVVGEAVSAIGDIYMFRWTELGGFENLGRIAETGTGTGAASGPDAPKSAGCSALGTTVASTQLNVISRTPAFWTPIA